jgi:hypothetical protein
MRMMRKLLRSGVVRVLAGVGLCLGIGAAPEDAAAVGITLPFTVELETGVTAQYGTVEIEEVGAGDLAFTITIDRSVLGPEARLREFYFNFSGNLDDDDRHKGDDWSKPGNGYGHRHHDDDDKRKGKGHQRDRDDDDDDDGLRISGIRCNGGACDDPFELDDDVEATGGDGARFDFGVDFGHGNEMLQIVSFILSAKSDLSLADVLDKASSTDDGIEAFFAAFVKGAGEDGEDKVTIAVVVPEPGTALLFALGLAGLAVGGRRPGN